MAVVHAGSLILLNTCESPSVELQESCDIVSYAGVRFMSLPVQRLPTLLSAPHHLSREIPAPGLITYTDLSQALAMSNLLFVAIDKNNTKRVEALKFWFSEGFLALDPLRLSLRQSDHADDSLHRMTEPCFNETR